MTFCLSCPVIPSPSCTVLVAHQYSCRDYASATQGCHWLCNCSAVMLSVPVEALFGPFVALKDHQTREKFETSSSLWQIKMIKYSWHRVEKPTPWWPLGHFVALICYSHFFGIEPTHYNVKELLDGDSSVLICMALAWHLHGLRQPLHSFVTSGCRYIVPNVQIHLFSIFGMSEQWNMLLGCHLLLMHNRKVFPYTYILLHCSLRMTWVG